jgi:glycosyltransferase involved in cell wall biosynthesis
MKKKEVDVIILTYNRKELLIQILNKLKTQTVQDFNLIITDDGSKELINPNDYPFIKRYIWDFDEGYNRVSKFNEAFNMCVSDKIIILDDDCIPLHDNFLESYINSLNHFDISRGIVIFSDGAGTAEQWFSTQNIGFKKDVIDKLKGFDPDFDGHYGYEDTDLGLSIKEHGFTISPFNSVSSVNHLGAYYKDGDRSDEVVGHNKNCFIKKWGFNP